MLTPFDDDGDIDFCGLENLIDFYLDRDVCGLFATCGSSEISMLEPQEIIRLCRATVKHTASRVPVVAGIPQCDSLPKQADFIKKVIDQGVQCAVLMASYMAQREHDEQYWKSQVQKLLDLLPHQPLGIYECPSPYHRLLPADTLQWIAQTGRFIFHKDTCCNSSAIRAKLKQCRNTALSFYNAHTASLIDSLNDGADGYCGVGANFYPELYVWLFENYKTQPQLSAELLKFLADSETVFGSHYPKFAKMFLKMRNVNIGDTCRVKTRDFAEHNIKAVAELFDKSKEYIALTQPAQVG